VSVSQKDSLMDTMTHITGVTSKKKDKSMLPITKIFKKLIET